MFTVFPAAVTGAPLRTSYQHHCSTGTQCLGYFASPQLRQRTARGRAAAHAHYLSLDAPARAMRSRACAGEAS